MEDNTIYRFIKNIIENGIRNNLSVAKLEEAIDTLLNNLRLQNLIPSTEISTLILLKRYIPLILRGSITVDEAYIEILKMQLIESTREKEVTEQPKMYTIGSCLRDRNTETNSCGSSNSSSSSCGSDRSSGRC